jgi:acyl-CoA dehydrogenase
MNGNRPIPFSEPPYLCGLPSPYYTESHLKWQKACREFIDRELIQNALEWDTNETLPESVFQRFAEANMLIPSLPAPLPVEWLKKLGIHELLGVLKVEDFDYLHGLIYGDEVTKNSPPPISPVFSLFFSVVVVSRTDQGNHR